MVRFDTDYVEGAHPRILDRLIETNMEQTHGYGVDEHCERAKELIRRACAPDDDVDVFFLVGGTQTNATVIDSVLRSNQGVIAASTGHINVHETGAVEATGHKVLAIPSADGKLHADDVKSLLQAHYADPDRIHSVQPGMVYISCPAENGLTYSYSELTQLHDLCNAYHIPLFVDGARLGYGLVSQGCNLTLADIAAHSDVFYIGGTKQGALFGEAVVIRNKDITPIFEYSIKQHGALLAKGRLLGIQFECLFEDDLYFELSKRADDFALYIRESLTAKGYKFWNDSTTNQQFVLLSDEVLARVSRDFVLESWGCDASGLHIVRICTSWATKPDNVEALIAAF